MAEFTFGNRYDNGLTLLQYITDAGAPYAPSNADIKVASWSTQLGGVNTANTLANTTSGTLKTAQDLRLTVIKTTLIETSAQIRDEIGSMTGGKKTPAYKNVQKTVQKMRGYKIPKPKAPAGTTPSPAEKKKISQSELSFGSMVSDAKKILALITSLAGYAPSNTALTVANYTLLITDCENKNKAVALALIANSNAVSDRLDKYDGLKGISVISQQIVDYIASTFTKSSTLYKQAVKLKI